MKNLGFEFLANLEFDEACVATLNANKETFPGKLITPLDITKISPELFYSGQIDYIVGGPPCQSFSAAGRRAGGVLGIEDARGTLFWHYCQFVKHFKPAAFVFENVRGILSSKGGEDFRIICNSFKDVGYNLYWRILNSADYGVPQFRERLYLVGVREDIKIQFQFPRPTYGPDSEEGKPYVTAEQAIGELDDLQVEVPAYGGKYGDLIPQIPEGENYRHFTEEMGHPNPQFAWRSKFSGFLYKMAKDQPCRTIVSQQSRYDGPLHWRNRKCTSAELKRLQGFPDSMSIPHSYQIAVKQIGNSVTPAVATALGRAIRYQIEGLDEYKCQLLESSEKLTFDKRKGRRAIISKEKKAKSVPGLRPPGLFDLTLNTAQIDFGTPISESIMRGLRTKEYMSGIDRRFELVGTANNVHDRSFELGLTFFGEFSEKMRSLSIRAMRIDDAAEALRIAWLLANRAVRTNSAYESLQPLWGHFTEPYPKFQISFEYSGEDVAFAFQKFIIARSMDKSLVSYVDLTRLVGPIDHVLRVATSIGFDVRTNETNMTIKEGFARLCYPFPILLSEES
jgi:DNA (cytosine-5)-methyltransferase 1